jgi:transcriptional regulator with XRE-family HTH domain
MPDDLRDWRKANFLSQSELAGLLGVWPLTISKWERGDRAIPPYLELALETLAGRRKSLIGYLRKSRRKPRSLTRRPKPPPEFFEVAL